MVDSVLEFDGFSKIIEKLKHNIPYLNAYSLNGQYIQSSDDELKNMSPVKMRALQQTIYENASKGIGFFYGHAQIACLRLPQQWPSRIHNLAQNGKWLIRIG